MAALATDGRLYLMNPTEIKITAQIQTLLPPKPNALTSTIYWAEANTIALSGSGGKLVLYSLTDNHVSILQAHEGEVYGLTIRNSHLLSAGIDDGLLKVWTNDNDQPIDVFDIPKGITSLTVTGDAANTVLLVDIYGKAQIFRWMQTGLVRNQIFQVKAIV